MLAGAGDDLVCLVNEAPGVDKVDGIESAGANVALITASVVGTTVWAGTLDKPIGQEPGRCRETDGFDR